MLTRFAFLSIISLVPRTLRAQCPDGTPPPCSRATAAAAPNSVAVLYFDNVSRDTSDTYLADGMTEELISRLGQVERLQVKSRTAVIRFRGRPLGDPAALGRTLSVAHLVSGSVFRSGPSLRVTVELMRSATGVSVWSRTFERPATDLIRVQAEIAESVAVGVSGRLLPDERRRLETRPTTSAEAYDHYLRGNYEQSRRTTAGMLRALQEYETASRMDPRFALPLVRAAVTYGLLASLYNGPEVTLPQDSLLARAKTLLDRGLRLDSTSAEAWLARANAFQEAPNLAALIARQRNAYEHAVRLDPRNAEIHHLYGLFLRNRNEDSAAAGELRRALALEPERAISLVNLGQLFTAGRQFAEGVKWIDSAAALRPEASFYYMEQALTHLQLGDTAGARAAAILTGAHRYPNGREEVLAMLDARAGDTAAARARVIPIDSAMRRVSCLISHPCIELIWGLAAAGERERALAVLERIPRDNWILWWSRRVEFDPIRDEPRFKAVIAESVRN